MTDERDDSPRPIEEQNDDGADTAILPSLQQEQTAPPPEPVPAGEDDDTLIEHLPVEADPSNDETRIDLRREPPPSAAETVSDEAAMSSTWSEYAPEGDEDVAAALAAVASLGEEFVELDEEADDEAVYEPDEPHDPFDAVETRVLTPAKPAPTFAPGIALPPMRTLKRGSIASIIPAFALIGVGAWLLFITTTGGTVDPLLLLGIGVAALVLSLFAYWVSTGRWSRGALFAAALIALTAGLFVIAVPPPNMTINTGITPLNAYPLLIAAVGIALLIGGALSRPSTRAAVAPGIVLLTAGIVGFLVTSGAISQTLLDSAAPLWFVPIVILVIIWLLPMIARMRGRD